MVSFDDFKKLDIRIAQIKEVKEHPNADKLYVLNVDIGDKQVELVAGVKEHYKADELVGKKVVVITNLEPATIRGVESKGMMLACKDGSLLAILVPQKDVKVGSKVS